MKTTMIKTAILAIVITMNINIQARAQKLTGRDIVEKAYNLPSGKDKTSILTMTLINSNGSTRVRKIKQFTKDLGSVEKSIMFFLSPADVKNTSFMNWSYDNDKPDDQWIYLPALKKVKRISSDSKSDYFMGSDFTYDDLGDRKLDADVHKLLREETVDGIACYVVESVPKDEDYIYSKTITWIRKENFVGLKKDFYDEDGELLKTLSIKEVKHISGIWVITHSEMHNVQKNHTTIMKLTDVKINTGVPASMFTERMMMRGI
jgi:outer membrane lipoprotein-sorting protein